MEEDKVIICRLCLKICQTGFENVDKNTREALNFLLLWMNLDITQEPVICTTCKGDLKKCFDFKTDYLFKTNSTYIQDKNIDLNDLKSDINGKINNSVSSISSSNICAFCMELVNEDSSALLKNEPKVVMTLEKSFPELVLNITEGSITCISCYKSMQIIVGFISSCLSVEEKVEEYCNVEGTNGEGQIELTPLLNFTFKSQLKGLGMRGDNVAKIGLGMRGGDNVAKIKEDYNQLENECETETKYKDFLEVKDQELSYNQKEASLKVEKCDSDRSLTRTEHDTNINMERSLELPPYKCHTCPYQSYFEDSLRRHICNLQRGSEIKLHACRLCLYRTDSKSCMRRHVLTHKNSFEVTMHKCDLCDFKTKYKNTLPQHMLIHKISTETLMHKCKICPFQTKHKVNIKKHMLTHENTSEGRMFKCANCSFQTKHKGSLRMHMLVHKNASEVTTYKCETCTFQTKRKGNVRKHMLTHKSTTEVTMHKCTICEFETKYKNNMRTHMVTHEEVGTSDVKMFKCDVSIPEQI